jgi:outer membrane protein OmpA-like peptidoglycan-associated protein
MGAEITNTNSLISAQGNIDMRRRCLAISIVLAIFFYSTILMFISNYKVLSLLPKKQARVKTKEFIITSIPSQLEDRTASNPAGEDDNYTPGSRKSIPSKTPSFERVFNSPQPRISPATISLPKVAQTLDISQSVNQGTFLKITNDGLLPVGSAPSAKNGIISVESSTNVALPPANFDLPSAIPGTLASEDLSSLEGAGRALGGIRTDDLPGLEEMARLFDPSKVQALETPQGIMLRMSNEVLFEFNSAQLTEDAVPILKEVAQILRRYAGAQVSIEGHTDTIGSADFNQKLSEQRALTVANWLNSQPAMVFRNPPQVVGYGESRPIVNPLGTREEQRQNRRVEIHIRAEKRTNSES